MKASFSLTVSLLLLTFGFAKAQSDTLEVTDTSTDELIDTTAQKVTKKESGYLYHMEHEKKGKLIYDPEVNEKSIDFYLAQGYEQKKVVPKDPEKRGTTMKAILQGIPVLVELLRIVFGIDKKNKATDDK